MTGIILFRAQPFHNGHLAQIKRALKDTADICKDLYILVGSADKVGTKRNPIPIDVRLDLIKNSCKEYYGNGWDMHLHIVPFNDLSDEANNTHSWGNYLYENMCKITGDTEFVFYYSDKPEIALSWFDDSTRNHLYFKFLPRVDNINATAVRAALVRLDRTDWMALGEDLPPYVYSKVNELHKYIINAR